MQQKERSRFIRNQTIEDEEKPPSYEDSTNQTWSKGKIIAVVGFIIIQLLLLGSIFNQLIFDDNQTNGYYPEQLHLSMGKNDSEYYLSWATTEPAKCRLVWSKKDHETSHSIQGQMFITDLQNDDDLPASHARKYFHRSKLPIVSGNKYNYYVTCSELKKGHQLKETTYSSKSYSFTAVPFDDHERTLSLIFYGDLGLKNAQSVPRLTKEVNSGQYDLIIHNGDFAYDLNTDHSKYGDEFMRLIESIAAKLPYQTSVGNHEVAANFSHYDKRFTMINRGPINSGQRNNFYYSYNAGPIHFIAISTEFYYFLDYSGLDPLINQYEWLKKDLAAANEATSRSKRPWIVVYGHRPMYCSSRDGDDCSKDSNLLRRGLPFTGAYALEKLFYENGVDVELYSHEHQYERFLPLYDGKLYNGTVKPDDPYRDARAPVHLISGSAGCQEKLDPFMGHPVTGSVKQISDYGYTRIKASPCFIKFEQVSDDQAGTIVDSFTLSKDGQNFPPEQAGKGGKRKCF